MGDPPLPAPVETPPSPLPYVAPKPEPIAPPPEQSRWDEAIDTVAPVPKAKDWGAAVDAFDRQQVAPLDNSVQAAATIQPDRAGQVAELAKQFDLPTDVVERQFDYLQGQRRINYFKDDQDFATIMQQRPALAKWLMDRDNAAIADGDIPILKKIHDDIASIYPIDPRAKTPWMPHLATSLLEQTQRSGRALLAGPAYVQQLLREALGITGAPHISTPLGQVYATTDWMSAMAKEREQLQPASVGQQLTSSVVNLLSDPMMMMVPVAGGFAAVRELEALKTLYGISEAATVKAAAKGASLTMGVQAGGKALEASTIEKQQRGEGTMPGWGEVSEAASQAALMALIGYHSGLPVQMRLMGKPLGPGVSALSDLPRQAATMAGIGVGSMIPPSLFLDRPLPTTGEVMMTALESGLGGAVLAIGNMPSTWAHAQGARMMDRALDLHRLQVIHEKLLDASGALSTSEAARRSPSRVEDLLKAVHEVAGEKQTGKLYFQTDEFDAHFRAKGADPKAAAQSLGVKPEDYDLALATKQQIEVSTPEFLVRTSKTKEAAELLAMASTEPGKPTFGQASEALKRLPEEIEAFGKLVAAEIPADPNASKTGQEIFDDIHQQLTKSGKAPEVAKTNALIWQRLFVNLTNWYNKAAGKQINPLDLYKSMGVTIERVMPDVLAQPDVRQAVEVQVNLLRKSLKEGADVPEHLKPMLAALKGAGLDIKKIKSNEDLFAKVSEGFAASASRTAMGEEHLVGGRPVVLAHIPYLAGWSKEGAHLYIDERLPRFLMIDGKRVDVHELVAQHEIAEKALMDGGMLYKDAHKQATKAEHDAVKALGVKPASYEKALEPYLAEVKKSAVKSRIPQDLDTRAYEQEGEMGLLEGAGGDPLALQHGRQEVKVRQEMEDINVALSDDAASKMAESLWENVPMEGTEKAVWRSLEEKDLFEALSLASGEIIDVSQSHIQFGTEHWPVPENVYFEFKKRVNTAKWIENVDAAQLDKIIKAWNEGKDPNLSKSGTGRYIMENAAHIIADYRATWKKMGESFEQPSDKGPPRASIAFGPLSTVIKLYQAENLSSFLHESGHGFLRVMGLLAERADAPADLKADWAALMAHIGAKGYADITPKQHENVAEMLEHYFREGKAPTPELRGAFARIKNWMLQVYEDIKDIYRSGGKPLNDEVRGIFDRMLASRDEIEAAAQRDAIDPLFGSAAQAGMTEDQYAAYTKRSLVVRTAGRERLERKALAAVVRQNTAEYAAQREEVRADVLQELNGDKALAAVAHLRDGEKPDGTAVDGPALKLDRQALIDYYSEENVKLLPRGITVKKGGVLPETASELLGFKSPDEMLEAIRTAPDLKVRIKEATDAKMRELYPDSYLDGTLAKMAPESLHAGDELSVVLDEEAQQLAKMTKASSVPKEIMRAVAKDKIGGMNPRSIKPDLFEVAAAKAGREAFLAASKGQLDKALVAKQRQIVNHYLFKAASEAVEEAGKIRDNVAKYLRPAIRERIGKAGGWRWTAVTPDGTFTHWTSEEAARTEAAKTPGATFERSNSYLHAIDRILENVELRKATGRQLEMRQALADFQADANAHGIPVDLPRSVLMEGAKKNWTTLTMDELRGVNDAVNDLAYQARHRNAVLKEQSAAGFDELTDKLADHLVKFSKGERKQNLGTGTLSGISSFLYDMREHQIRVTDYIRRINGHEEGGDLFWNWQHPINVAGDNHGLMTEAACVEQSRLLKELGETGAIGSIGLTHREVIPISGGRTVELNKWGQIMVCLNYGTTGNRERLLEGMKWTEADVYAIMNRLNAKERAYVKGQWKHVGSYWSEIAALEERVHGVAPARVEATPFMLGGEEMPGGYFPIVNDYGNAAPPMRETPEEIAKSMLAGHGYGSTMTEHGFAYERTVGIGKPIKLDISVISTHLDRVIRDLAFRETLIGLSKLLKLPARNGTSFGNTLIAHWGKGAFDAFEDQLMSLARGPTMDTGWLGKALEFLRQGFNASTRAFNIIYALKQPLGIVAGVPRLKGVYAMRALNKVMTPGGWQEALKFSTALRLRTKEHNVYLNENLKRTGTLAALAPFQDTAYLFAGKAWQFQDIHAWWAGYYRALDMKEVAGDHQKAVAIANQILVDTQGGFRPQDLPAAHKGGAFNRIFTNQMSWANANLNLMLAALHRFVDKHYTPAAAAQMVSDMAVYLVVAPAFYLAGSQLLTGESMEDWKDPKKIGKMVAAEGIYTGVSGIPLARDISTSLTEGRRFEGPQGMAAIAAIANTVTASRNAAKRALEGKDPRWEPALRGTLRVGGILTYFPASQVQHMLDWYMNAEANGENPISPRILLGPPPRK